MDSKLTRRELLKTGAAAMGGLLIGTQWTGRALAAQADAPTANPAAAQSMRLLDFQKLTTAEDFWTESPAMASNGVNAWLASLQHQSGDVERIIVHTFEGQWSQPATITPNDGFYEDPAIACATHGRPMLVWVRNEGQDWFLESLYDLQQTAGVVRVPGNGARATHPQLTAGPNGRFVLAWEFYGEGRFGIALQVFQDGQWSGKIVSLVSEQNMYDPALAMTADGALYVAYSHSDGPHRNVCLRKFELGDEGELKAVPVQGADLEMPVFTGGKLHAKALPVINNYPALGLDAHGDLWITCESREPVKGLPSFFGERVCPVVRYRDGNLDEIVPADDTHGGRLALTDNEHFPTFQLDGDGRLWLFGRTFLPNRTWNLRVTCLEEGKGWSKPVALVEGERFGRKTRPAVGFTGINMLLAWQADTWFQCEGKAVKAEETTCELCAAGVAPDMAPVMPAPLKMTAAARGKVETRPVGRPHVPRRTIDVNGEQFTLLYGNLHEHTDLSRCWDDGSDGTLDDNYRYGMDVEGYDFVGLTDHGFDLYEAAWRQSRRRAKFYNQPPHFVAVPSYEWTLSAATMGKLGTCPDGSGHRNVIFASDEDAARLVRDGKVIFNCFTEETNRIDKLWAMLRERGIRAVAIPHHPVDSQHPVSWKYTDNEIESVLEIYQCRGSGEYPGCPGEGPAKALFGDPACYADAALRSGHRIGFIASGDHNSMGVGLAALYVREVSQEGIQEALRARRCFGTMGDKMFIDFRVDGRLMGQEFATAGKPRLTALIETPEPLARVTVMKNSKPLKEFAGDTLKHPQRFELDMVDEAFDADAWYYIRAIQKNKQIAWASPVWVNKA